MAPRALALLALCVVGCNDHTVGIVPAAQATPTTAAATAVVDPLPSWNEGPTKRGIVDFVERVTRAGGPDFVPIAERIAVFDNDGTLWIEQPMPVELAFTIDRVKALAPQHSDWKYQQPYAGILDGKLAALTASGQRGLEEVLMATHAGNTTEEFDHVVSEWIATAQHPRFHRKYTQLVYQPMLELLAYLRARGFKTFIVSGGGVEFMRPWTDPTYGIPPEHVIGSRIELAYQHRRGEPVLERLPNVEMIDDKAGKPIGIQQMIGRRPIAAFGNTDGDFDMLEWTTSGSGARLGLLVHHTDAIREYAYDKTQFGDLARGLEEAPSRGWLVADMARDWKTIFPAEAR